MTTFTKSHQNPTLSNKTNDRNLKFETHADVFMDQHLGSTSGHELKSNVISLRLIQTQYDLVKVMTLREDGHTEAWVVSISDPD